jgi:multiple sugar transport system substrate-binding protein
MTELEATKLSRRDVVKTGALLVTVPLIGAGTAAAQDDVKLTILTHWGEQHVTEAIDPQLDYCAEQTGVTVEHQTVDFADLLTRITSGRLAGETPDIYHFYNLWLPDFVGSELLVTPPADVVAEIEAGWSETSVDGSSYGGQVWGFPTEVNSYQLIYNKQMLQEAGVEQPPATWAELKDAARKATKKGADGRVTQAGLILVPIKDWDSGVVHPWTSLLWSNGGEYVSPDISEAHFNQPPGVETLQLELDMIKDGSVDLSLLMEDFIAGKAAMIIMANWWGAELREGMTGGIENVGVAPIPHNENDQSVTLQYNWLWGVDKNSEHAEEAWAFLTCLNTPRDGGSSPTGEFLTTGLNAIPSRLSDQEAHADFLGDPFVKPFVDALQTARTEPIIPGAQEIKTTLQKQIEAAWFGEKEAQAALDEAAQAANRILAEKG